MWWLNQLLPLALAKEKGGLLGGGGELEKLQELSMLPLISCRRGALKESHGLNSALNWPSYLRASLGHPSVFTKEDSSDLQTKKRAINIAGNDFGKGLQHSTHCCPYPLERCSLYLWLDGSTPPGMFSCSSRRVSAMGGLLGHILRPIASCSLPITRPKLGGPGYKANFASSSRIIVSLCVPL